MSSSQGAIDLSRLGMDEPSYDELPEDVRAKVDAMAEQHDVELPAGRRVRTAFRVIVLPDGEVRAVEDLEEPLLLDHRPTVNDMQSACRIVESEIVASKTATTVQMLMMQMGQQMQEQMAQAQIRQKLGNLRG